jgi:hypothetical protein
MIIIGIRLVWTKFHCSNQLKATGMWPFLLFEIKNENSSIRIKKNH